MSSDQRPANAHDFWWGIMVGLFIFLCGIGIGASTMVLTIPPPAVILTPLYNGHNIAKDDFVVIAPKPGMENDVSVLKPGVYRVDAVWSSGEYPREDDNIVLADHPTAGRRIAFTQTGLRQETGHSVIVVVPPGSNAHKRLSEMFLASVLKKANDENPSPSSPSSAQPADKK